MMNTRKKVCFRVQESTRSPLARLVLFIVCLSIAGSIVAGVHYYAVDLPQQQNVQAPANSCGNYVEKQFECSSRCGQDPVCYGNCLTEDC
jgi:archaellum component FlaG (FlaF/FlaG flagellin family)